MSQQTTRLFSASSAARVATLAIALVAGGAAAVPGDVAGAELGRLFFTPEERARLDELRNPKPEVVAPAPVVVEKPPEPPPPAEPPPPPPDVPPIVVNGLVKRSDGNNTAWVNGMPTLTGDLSDSHIGVETSRIDGSRVPIRTPAHLPDVLLKPGQRFDPHGDLPVTDVIPGPVNGETPGRSSQRD